MGVEVPAKLRTHMHFVPVKTRSLDQEHAAVLPVHAMVESIKGGAVPIQEVRPSAVCVLELVPCGWVDLSKGRIKSTLDFPALFFDLISLGRLLSDLRGQA